MDIFVSHEWPTLATSTATPKQIGFLTRFKPHFQKDVRLCFIMYRFKTTNWGLKIWVILWDIFCLVFGLVHIFMWNSIIRSFTKEQMDKQQNSLVSINLCQKDNTWMFLKLEKILKSLNQYLEALKVSKVKNMNIDLNNNLDWNLLVIMLKKRKKKIK